MKDKIVFLFFFLLSLNLKSQNLIQNWSFEDTIPCINNPNAGLPESAPPWFNPISGSPDYLSTAYCGGLPIPFGYQIAKTGLAFMGIITLNTFPNYREYFEEPLYDSLKTGHRYCVSFYYSLADQCKYATDAIGAYFSIDSLTNTSNQVLYVIPQVESSIGMPLTDTMNWVLLSGDFIAQGGEKFITIGSFKNDSSTTIDTLSYGTALGAYYYIDDVTVMDCTVGIEENQEDYLDLEIYPNPNTGNFTIILQDCPIQKIRILDLSGRIIFSKDKIINNIYECSLTLDDGIYIVEVCNKRSIHKTKVIVTR